MIILFYVLRVFKEDEKFQRRLFMWWKKQTCRQEKKNARLSLTGSVHFYNFLNSLYCRIECF